MNDKPNAAPQEKVSAAQSSSPGVVPARASSEAGKERWKVFCPSCKVEWVVDYRHPGAELCERCEARAMFPDERSATSDEG